LVTRIPAKLAISLAIAACTFTAPAARAEQVPTTPTPAVDPGAVPGETALREGERTRLTVRTPLDASFTSNLFHVQDRRVANFDSHLAPGDRFDGISALWDVILRPGARAALDVPIGKKRDVELGLGADYYLHQQNGIADYLRLLADGAFDLTRHDTAAVEVKYVPRRFAKNHHPPQDAVNFEHDYVSQLDLVARYDREWSRAIATRVEYQLERNAHDDPFHDRDALGHEGRASLLLDVGKGSRISVGGGFGVSTSPGGYEDRGLAVDVFVDRSFRDAVILAGARFAASALVELDADLEVRSRDFTTAEGEDTTYFGRVDRRVKLEVDVTRKVGRGLSLQGFAGWTRNYSNRSNSNLTAEDAGYKEVVLGAAATWRFSTGGGR
jgi:hypothetical protein